MLKTCMTLHRSPKPDCCCCGVPVQTNMFQIQLVTHLQSDAVPSAVVESVRDLSAAIEAATLEDLYTFYDRLRLSDADVFTCIGTSGPEVCLPAAPCASTASLAQPSSRCVSGKPWQHLEMGCCTVTACLHTCWNPIPLWWTGWS